MITGVALVRNEAPNIVDCLKSFRPYLGQLILVDMESSDNTIELAKPYVDLVLRHPLVPNFDIARHLAIPHAHFDWLWFFDADERARPQTGQLVNQLIREYGDKISAITLPFQTYFARQWIQHSGWWPGYTMPRVLKRGHFKFREELHSGVAVDGPELRLPPDPNLAIEHFSYRSVEHYVEKFNRYTSTEALNLAQHGAIPDWREAVRAMTRDWWLYYERNEGHRDGYRGWILAWLAGQYRWFAHAKLSDLPQFQANLASSAVPGGLDEVLSVIDQELASLRGVPVTDQSAVVFCSPLFDSSGYADDGRVLLKALSRGKHDVTAQEIRWSETVCTLPEADVALFRALLRGRHRWPDIRITNCIPTLCPPAQLGGFQVLRTTFETDRIPANWLPLLERFDEVWVCARHNVTAFRRAGVPPEKIRILPGFIDTTVFTPEGDQLELPAVCRGRFVFLSVFDWQLRKGWDVLLRAYAKEFSVDSGKALLLKVTRSVGYAPEQVRAQAEQVLREMGQSLPDRPDIVIWPELLEPSAMAALYRSVDAFVLASRGEGWGRPYMEAMASGLVTIGTRGSGNDDFMQETNSLLVDTALATVSAAAAAELSIYAGHQWCEPNADRLRECLRIATSNSAQLVQLRAQAVQDMRSGYSLDQARTTMERLIVDIEARQSAKTAPEAPAEAARVRLEGELFAGHSFANLNEQLALGLGGHPDVALSIHRELYNPTQDAAVPTAGQIRPFIDRALSQDPEVVIRHAFPPNWQRPSSGRWVHIQPWEFGSLPREWVPPLRDHVDEIWVPSNYVREVYVRSGIPAGKIHVIPWGIDPDVYRPDVPRLVLPHEDCFRFLYVGGTVERKGFDLLLRAFREEFSADEPVALVIKDVGTRTFYRYGNARDEVLRLIAEGQGPRLVYLDREMTDGTRVSLYAACDCLVAPYRGEGFGLPVLEAMACGLPPIVPCGGATDDFVTDDTGFRLPSRVVECFHGWRLCGPATELAIEIDDLRAALRQAYDDPARTRQRGDLASQVARRDFTWDRTIERMVERINALQNGAPSIEQPLAGQEMVQADPWAGRPDLSVCVLTHNMEGFLGDSLAQVRPWVREIIVHDLGSTDRTLDIAREFGARITIGVDTDHRAGARNTALQRATSEWVLSLDGDEFIADSDLERLGRILAEAPNDVLGLNLHVIGPETSTDQNGWHGEVRVFRNRNALVFECRGAERVTPSIRRLGGRVLDVPITVRQGLETAEAQQKRRGRLHLDLAERHRDAESLWSLGIAHARTGDFFHAESFLHDCLTSVAPTEPLHREALTLLVECYRRTGDEYRANEFAEKLRNLPQGAL